MVSLAAADAIDLDNNPHLDANMDRDGLLQEDINAVLTEPLSVESNEGRDDRTADFTVRGRDLDGRKVTVAVDLDPEAVVVVTAFVER